MENKTRNNGFERCLFLPILLSFTFFFLTGIEAFSQKKRALIVAIGNYAPETKWGKISSANDVPMIKEALSRQGFEDIEVVADEQATKKGVLGQFEKLLNKTQKDDVILIHFSTHGQQIEDLSGDEVDGFDEAIICHDSPKEFKKGYKGNRHLNDDELADWILKIRTKAGSKGDVFLLADACHSGSLSRSVGTLTVRGGAAALSLTGKEVKAKRTKEAFLSNDEKLDSDMNDLAPYAIISAASANQLNYEIMDDDFKTYGSLSYAFNKVINKASANETYRSLFAKIQSEMKVLVMSQTPEIEGLLDRKIWAGAVVEAEPYYTIIDTIADLESNEIEINGGEVHGITVGSKIELYPLGNYASEEAKPANEGLVTQTNTFNSIVKLNRNLDLKKYWAYVSEKVYEDVFTNVSFRDFEQGEYLKAKLLESRIIKSDQNSVIELILEKTDKGEIVLLNAVTMKQMGDSFKLNDGDDAIKTAIENYTKSKFLLRFNPQSEGLDARLIIIPSTTSQIKDTVSIAKFIHNGLVSMGLKQSFFLKVINESDQKIFYNIIDIDVENNIAVVIPESQDFDGKDYWIEPHSSKIVARNNEKLNFEIYAPYGSETLKLFISDIPIDLRSLSNSKSRNLMENPLNNLEKVFDFAGKMGTRSIDKETYSSKSKASSYALNFQIVPSDTEK